LTKTQSMHTLRTRPVECTFLPTVRISRLILSIYAKSRKLRVDHSLQIYLLADNSGIPAAEHQQDDK